MGKSYQVIGKGARDYRKQLGKLLVNNGQVLLPLLELLETGTTALDEVIDVMGRATIETLLEISAMQVAGPKQQGKRGKASDVGWHGRQPGRVALKDRFLRVERPRLRNRTTGEVRVPLYDAMGSDGALVDRVLQTMMRGVSTRNYEAVLPELVDQVGISKSEVSRNFIAAGEKVLRGLAERDFSNLDMLVVYIDGIRFAEHHVLTAIGVDAAGKKHVLGLRDGASENAEVTKALLEDLVERGIRPGRKRLFVIDGAKALRRAIDDVYGLDNPVQRCRNHKLRNVRGHLPKDQHRQASSTLRAAWKLPDKDGKRKIEQYASWLERDWPSAAGSLREGLHELFTVNRLGLPSKLCRCLATTNVIDNSHSGVRQRTRRVTNWKNGSMVLRWSAAAFEATEKSFRRIHGYRDLWMLQAHLDALTDSGQARKAG